MQLSRRNFLTTGMGLVGTSILAPNIILCAPRLNLDQAFLERHRRLIEGNILSAMESLYLKYDVTFDESYRPGLKLNEKIVSFYDYSATGISVLALLASKGNPRAVHLMKKLQKNIVYYQEKIYGTAVAGGRNWNIPLRRFLLHVALAYKQMEPFYSNEEKQWYSEMIDQQVELAIEHNGNFFQGEMNLKRTSTNNHTAIFMQGIYYCGKVFNRPKWIQLTEEFAQRMYDCIRPDGYFEENTNEQHEGGPSMIYTRLTIGSIYDVLNGKSNPREKFIMAGNFYRSFINHDYRMISIADERTNCHNSKGLDYGLALHSLTPKGRYFIVDNLDALDYGKLSIEHLAVIHHELGLMKTGECSVPENRIDGNSRISLPLGVVRKNGFTAGVSALLALNRIIRPNSDYAIDQQNMVYLSHEKAGLILIGYKSKRNPLFSTFRIGEDAYTIKTGKLEMGKGWAEATLYYKTFTSKIRWDIGKSARLTLSTDSDQMVSTTLTIIDEQYVKSKSSAKLVDLEGFSPYSQDNKTEKIKCLIFEWKKELVVDFIC
jgi:hypothetical protein